jgi:predicted Zn-dependent peptidase
VKLKLLLLTFLFLTALFGSDPYKNITHYKLNNGLEVYLYPDNKAKNTAIDVDVKVGMKAEDENSAGISHLVEHLVFRDARIKDRDYLDLFEKEGASYVNGYTRYYKTQYLTTIKSEKSYWIVEQFAQMLLDKNVTKTDLEAERGALQVEIGEFTWADRFLPTVKKGLDFMKDLFPPQPDFYKDEFGIDLKNEEIKYQPRSIYRLNNQKFTLEDVMKHYHDYYYPSNMILNVVGNFDLLKMKNTIEKSFGKFAKKEGKTVEKKVYKVAKLNQKAYEQYAIGVDRNRATIGAKFIADDPKKVIILKSYVKNLAERLNRVFRNKNGESYGAYGSYNHYQNGAIATVSFNTEHNAFDKNIKYAQDQIRKELNGELTDEKILEALKNGEKEFTSYEHDHSSLMDIIFSYQSFQKVFGGTKTPYEILKSVTLQEFKTTVQETFIPKNSYKYIIRDYRFFPHEVSIFFLLISIVMFYFIYKFFGAKPHKRIMFERRLTNRFLSFWIILSAIVISAIITEWILHFVTTSLPISHLWSSGYDAPLSYIVYLLDFIISVAVLYVVVKKLYKWFYTKLFITDSNLIISGVKSRYINTKDIESIETVKWNPSLIGQVHGISLLFWKPLLKIVSQNKNEIYIRTNNAEHLKDDLEFTILDKK